MIKPRIDKSYGAEDVAAMAARQLVLDKLYRLTGRDNPDHEMHGLYTGVAQEAKQLHDAAS